LIRVDEAADGAGQAGEPTGKRAQILRELRRQIGLRGIERITMRNLAAEAGVALATLYNLFGSKEAMVVEAVRETHRLVMGSMIQDDPAAGAFDQVIGYACRSAQFILSEPIYGKAMVYAYYVAKESENLFHRDLQDYIGATLANLLAEMQRLGELRAWSSPLLIARQMTEALFGIASQWSRQVIPDEAFIDTALLTSLSLLHVHLNDRRRAQTEARIRDVSQKLEAMSWAGNRAIGGGRGDAKRAVGDDG